MKNYYKIKSIFFCSIFLFLLNPLLAIDYDGLSKTKQQKLVGELLKNAPVRFIENKGQLCDMAYKAIPHVWFKAEAPGMDFYLTNTGLTYVFKKCLDDKEGPPEPGRKPEERRKTQWEKVELFLVGANLKRENIVKEGEGVTSYNYFFDHLPNGLYGVHDYEKITVKDVYPGIDWVFYNSNKSGFKYDFIVHPGANPNQIQMAYRSLSPISTNFAGNLIITTQIGELTEHAPITYQRDKLKKIESNFVISQSRQYEGQYETVIGFNIDLQSTTSGVSQELVIDPQLVWSTFYGGTSFEGTFVLDTDPSGDLFSCGYTGTNNLPLVNAGTYFESTQRTGFIIKFNSAGTLTWATYVGTATGLNLNFLACDQQGNVFVVGTVSGSGLPTVSLGTYFQAAGAGSSDIALLKFSNNGTLLWGTYYGGSASDQGSAIATDQNGNIFVSGTTASTNFPVFNAGTYFQGSFSGSSNSGYILKFDNSGNRLWATFYERISGEAIATDLTGNVLLTGVSQTNMSVFDPGGGAYYQPTIAGAGDAYVLKFDNLGNQLWATYYGGALADQGRTIKADKSGNIFVSGITSSTNFPLLNAGTYFQSTNTGTATTNVDIFMLKFDPLGVRLWSTYYGGTRAESIITGDNMALDTCGNLYVSFETTSSNVPTITACEGGYQDSYRDTSFNTGYRDLFIARFSNAGDLMWGTYFGGNGNDFRGPLQVDETGNLYVAGEWIPAAGGSSTYPVVDPGGVAFMDSTHNGSDDVFLLKFNILVTPQNFTYSGPLCTSDTLNVLPIFSGGFSPSSLFFSAPGLSLDPQTGQITPSLSLPGTYTVNYPSTYCYCAGATANPISTVVQIGAAPSLTLTAPNTICIGNSGTVSAQGANSYKWHTGAITNSIVLTINSNAIVTVTGSAVNGCATTSTLLVKVNSCVGLNDITLGNKHISVFANPNQGNFTINSDEDVELYLVTVLGLWVRDIKLDATNSREIKIENLPTGIYFLQNKEGEQKLNHKIVVE